MSHPVVIFADYTTQAHRANTADQRQPVGQRMEYADGRKWRYVLIGATVIAFGNLVQGKTLVAGDYTDVLLQAAAAVGDTTVSITASGTSVANFYAKGWMHVNKGTTLGTDSGMNYKVKSHPVFAAATKVITLEPDDPIRVAMDTTNGEVGFTPNPYTCAIVAPITTATNVVIGVSQTRITAAQYGFVQSGGVSCVQSAASHVVGNRLNPILAAAGRAGVPTASLLAEIGLVLSVPTTAGEYGSVLLTID